MQKNILQKGAVTMQTMIAIFGVTLGTLLYIATGNCIGVDGSTGMTCEEIRDNPGQDIYFIVDGSEINNATIFQEAQQDPETVRWNNAHTQFVIKYNVSTLPRDQVEAPSCIISCTRPLKNPKSHEQIVAEMETTDWQDPNSDDPIVDIPDPRVFVEDDKFERE